MVVCLCVCLIQPHGCYNSVNIMYVNSEKEIWCLLWSRLLIRDRPTDETGVRHFPLDLFPAEIPGGNSSSHKCPGTFPSPFSRTSRISTTPVAPARRNTNVLLILLYVLSIQLQRRTSCFTEIITINYSKKNTSLALRQQYFNYYKSSATAEMATQRCTFRIFVVAWGGRG